MTVLTVLRGCDLGVWTVFKVLTVYSRCLYFWTVLTGCVMCIWVVFTVLSVLSVLNWGVLDVWTALTALIGVFGSFYD